MAQDEKLMQLIVEKKADIKINYLRREDLPLEVKPQVNLLGKRTQREEHEEHMRDDYQEEIV